VGIHGMNWARKLEKVKKMEMYDKFVIKNKKK
jgi:hypothetical protein